MPRTIPRGGVTRYYSSLRSFRPPGDTHDEIRPRQLQPGRAHTLPRLDSSSSNGRNTRVGALHILQTEGGACLLLRTLFLFACFAWPAQSSCERLLSPLLELRQPLNAWRVQENHQGRDDMEHPVINTSSGSVRGSVAGNVLSFKGIPYAEPPFGRRRFRPPEPVKPCHGICDALTYGPTAPKPPYFPPFDAILPEPAIPGEECLNLNIWTPVTGDAKLPVLVWIHGGAFSNGSNAVSAYDGSSFARDGVICVSINYRLGVDGFLFLGDGISNLGILDQLLALKWVHENIAAFGGDPSNVTIPGESAGRLSVTTLLSMEQSGGLFWRG